DDVAEAGTEDRGEREEQGEQGEGHQRVDQAGEQEVDLAAEVASGGADEDADGDGDGGRSNADDEGDAGAVNDAGEDIAADVVVAEPVFGAGRGTTELGVDSVGVVGSDPGREDGAEDEEHDETEPEQGGAVAREPPPGFDAGIP